MVSTTGMVVSLKTDLRFPESGQQGHGAQIIHRLNQATFAEKAGISLSIYSKWEGGSRHPSRKMFRQLVNTYPEINI